MKYYWIEDIKEFQDIAKKWDNALLLSKEDNPFLLSDFIITWWKYYSQNLKLQIFVLYQNGTIVGGLPLYRNRNGFLEYIGRWTANYTEFLSVNIDRHIVWETFFISLSERKDWSYVYLTRFREKKLDIDKLKAIVFNGYKKILFDIYRSEYTYLINIPKVFLDYFNHLPRKLRYYIKRSEKGFSRLGKVNLYSFNSCNEIDKISDKYISLSRDSFKRRNNRSAFEDPKYCMFFKELINKFSKAGYLDANVLKLDDRIIAIHFGYSIGKNLNYIFPTFDMDFAQLNPGHLLILKLVKLGSERGNHILDLYTGGHLYKEQWSTHKEEIVSIEIRPNNIRSKIKRKIAKQIRSLIIIGRIKDAIRSFPMLTKIARRIREFFKNYV